MFYNQINRTQSSHQKCPDEGGGDCPVVVSKRQPPPVHLIHCTLVVILAILLLLIAVSGILILIITNEGCSQWTSKNLRPNLYSLAIYQLVVIIFEALTALVIVFFDEIGCDSIGRGSATNQGFHKSLTTDYHPVSTGQQPTTGYYSRSCNTFCTLKLAFIILTSISFVLRIFIIWSGQWSSNETIASSGSIPVLNSGSYISGLIYATTLFESMLIILILTTNTFNTINNTTRMDYTSR